MVLISPDQTFECGKCIIDLTLVVRLTNYDLGLESILGF